VNREQFDRLPRARQLSLVHTAPLAYVNDHGILCWGAPACIDPALVEGARHYDPYDRVELANALAKVSDERSALRFARQFGLLGYDELLLSLEGEAVTAEMRGQQPDPLLDTGALKELLDGLGGELGDPLPWLFAQARSVRLALDLIEALPGGSETIIAVAQRHSVPRLDSSGHISARLVQLAYALRTEELDLMDDLLRARRPAQDLPEEQLRPLLATLLIEELVNANTAGLQWRLYSPPAQGPYRLAVGFGQQALFQVVWWHVGNAAVGGKRGTRVRLCELESCRAPFIVTDERQRFCPADYVYKDKTGRERPGRSRCAALYHKRHGKQGSQP